VNLSDGGHFENLGLYEMVLRRCGHIVVVDAGCDYAYVFEDLGNAIRKIRIDLGISIDIQTVSPRKEGAQVSYYAIGTIRTNRRLGTDGTCFTLSHSLWAGAADAPTTQPPSRISTNQPATNGSAMQMESYRALGFHAVTTICRSATKYQHLRNSSAISPEAVIPGCTVAERPCAPERLSSGSTITSKIFTALNTKHR
jgi:hypothetical protein